MSLLSQTELLKVTLEELFKKKVDLVVQDNRSIFLNARFISSNRLKISLHQAFCQAPYYILISLREYLIKNKKEGLRNIKNYMDSFFEKKDYSSHLDREKLKIQGKVYNLEEIFEKLNKKYFANRVEGLNISWFKKPKYKNRGSVTFGSYDRSLKLIKVNEILDNDFFPPYFVSYIVFHEILHHEFPIIIDPKGRRKIHYRDFKIAEKKFDHFKEAMAFEKYFLKKRSLYGRT
jgi:hypothetical protein